MNYANNNAFAADGDDKAKLLGDRVDEEIEALKQYWVELCAEESPGELWELIPRFQLKQEVWTAIASYGIEGYTEDAIDLLLSQPEGKILNFVTDAVEDHALEEGDELGTPLEYIDNVINDLPLKNLERANKVYGGDIYVSPDELYKDKNKGNSDGNDYSKGKDNPDGDGNDNGNSDNNTK